MRIVLSGGTGFIGRSLASRLIAEKHRVFLLTRNPQAARDMASESLEILQWDGKTLGQWVQLVENADAVINLAGESVGARRWSQKQKARLINSRLDATKAIVAAIAQAKNKPSVLINASGVGYYDHVENGDVEESHPPGKDFLSQLAIGWEREATAAESYGVRVARLRFGVVLAKGGGALKRMMLPFKLFVGGTIGSGRQWLPWVHRHDVLNIVLFVLENAKLSGPVNVVAPEPVTMKEFCKALGKAMHRPSWVPVPAFALRLLLGEMADMVLTGQRAIPSRLQEAGYKFLYPKLDDALAAIFRSESHAGK